MITDLAREIGQTLSHNKVRTALTGIAVTWGIFMLIVLLGVARGVTNSFEEGMSTHENEVIRVYSGQTSIPYRGNREGRYIRLNEGDMKGIAVNDMQHVKNVTARIYGGKQISHLDKSVSASYDGVFPSAASQVSLDSLRGRFINERDMRETSKVIVMPKSIVKQLFPPEGEGAVGSRVNVDGLSFIVVGVFSNRWNNSSYIPYTTAHMLSADKEDLGNLTVQLKNVETEDDGTAAEKSVKNTLATRHNFNPDDDSAVFLANYFNNSLTAKKGIGILDTSVWILGILTLLTGIVGVSNIMFVTVRERTHEIGIRRAIGAKPRKIIMQIIAESVSITLLFGYIGIVLGMIVTQIIAHFTEDSGVLLNPTVSISIACEVTLVLVLAGAFAGLFPALKAMKVKPVEALRYE